MCGIAGVMSFDDAPVDAERLVRIRDAMAARGPDGAGLWVSDSRRVALAHRRLAIIDLSPNGAQPMSFGDGRLVITFNGEIYNYKELREECTRRGIVLRTQSDTETILAIYSLEGVAGLRRLRGMFAFGLWDAERQSLVLARDGMGIKPLYYGAGARTAWFASQVKPLLHAPVDLTPDPAGYAGYLQWGAVPEPFTLYRGIRQVPPGTVIEIDRAGRQQRHAFYEVGDEFLSIDRAHEASPPADKRTFLREAVLDTVRSHLVADVPVGVFLSAGIDSSVIASAAIEIGHRSLTSVTLGFREFQGTPLDETSLAAEHAARLGIRHETVWVRYEDFVEELPSLLAAMDQPSHDGVNSYFVAKAARAVGLKVALSGLGADEVFGGYPSFSTVPRLLRLRKTLPLAGPLGQGLEWINRHLGATRLPPKLLSALAHGGSVERAYLLRRAMFLPHELEEFLSPAVLAEGLGALDTEQRLRDSLRPGQTHRASIGALELQWYMRNQLLRDTDWASMAHSVEVRVPFVDVRLLQRLAPMICGDAPLSKHDLSGCLSEPLPESIQRRPKTGFAMPVREWLQRSTPTTRYRRGLRAWAEEVLTFQAPRGVLRKRNVLIFRIGQLGDTLVAMPAIARIRDSHRSDNLVLLSNKPKSAHHVSAWSVLENTGWFTDLVDYGQEGGWLQRLVGRTRLLHSLRKMKLDVVFNLSPHRSLAQRMRDQVALGWLLGPRRYAESTSVVLPPRHSRPLPRVPAEWTRLLGGVGARKTDFIFPVHQDVLRTGLERIEAAFGNRPVVALGVGSKMPAKVWPLERFSTLVARLAEKYPDVGFVVLGGPEDHDAAETLAASFPDRILNLAGTTTIEESAAVLRTCALYVGVDTGTMHLAAANGVRCVALFSARDYPGLWEPFGEGHVIIRKAVECEGCMVEVCAVKQNLCMRLIEVDEVQRNVEPLLDSLRATA